MIESQSSSRQQIRRTSYRPTPKGVLDRRDREAESVRAAVAGDLDAIQEIYNEHAGAISRFLRLKISPRSGVSDLVQEVFLQFWTQIERYDPMCSSLRSWLFVIARSRATDAMRSNGARAAREHRYADAEHVASGSTSEGVSSAHRRLLAKRLRAALERLPECQRRCVELAYFGELTHAQVAERLQQPLGTVKSRILLGVDKLRRELKG